MKNIENSAAVGKDDISELSDPDPDFDLNLGGSNRLLTIFKSYQSNLKTPDKPCQPGPPSSSSEDKNTGIDRKKFVEQTPEKINRRASKANAQPIRVKKRIKIAENDDYTTEEENFQAVTRPGMNHIHQIKKDFI